MSQELGKMEKPEVSSFKQSRKLIQVPLIYSGKDSPADYLELFNKYWLQAGEQITKLENSLGSVTVIFHETLSPGDDEGLKVLEGLNPKGHGIISEKCKGGVRLGCIEDNELLEEVMDWERCIIMGFLSEKVAKRVYEFYTEASRRRYEHMGEVIRQEIKEGDVALLFIREGHMIQFPADIDVFSVAPPALDEIRRWARERASKKERGPGEEPA